MYAFLSKVFGRKKDDRDASSSSHPVLGPGELLGGRFEAVSANVSPSSQCLELDPDVNEVKDKEKEKDKDVGFSFFKGKWRPASPDVRPTRKLDMLPHLSLSFQEPKAEPATPFLLFTTDQILPDADIGQRRLNPSEALILVQACSRAIVARGLETLGIMHPHWYAASHKVQRRVISHFIYLLNLENATPLASPTSPLSAFDGEVNDTFSTHDIAAILRWGLRHVQIEGESFGTDVAWYKTFLESEGAAGYPPKAFSDKLAPLLPTAHLQLLTATLEIFSSLAAHAEVNGTSGSKLCKLFGLWLLTAHRVEDNDDWKSFYARWERTGRMLEHLFLSRIRDQATDQRMPIRLLELIRKYPYNEGLSSPTTDLSLLPHPPFTTRLYDALFVRIEIELPYGKRKPSSKLHPLSLLAGAFSTNVEGEYADLWVKITTASKNGDTLFLPNIFTDDTISYLSIVPDESSGQEVKSPTFDLASSSVSPHKLSYSLDDEDKSAAFVPEHPKLATEIISSTPLSPLNNGIGSDWAQFSTSGFLEVNPSTIPLASTLFDTDIEKTTPPEAVTPLSRKSSKRSKAASPSSPRKSFDLHRPTSPETKLEGIEEQKNIIKASHPRIIQLDEAFIDFWSDSLLDPISATWPTFVICKFKSSLVPELTFGAAQEAQKQKTIQLLLLEQVYTIRTPDIAPIVVVRPRPTSPSSPSPSLKQRFSFWSVSRSASNASASSQKGKRKEQELRVGEMGELVEEEPKTEGKEVTVRVKSPIFRPRRSLDIVPKSTETKRKSVIVKPAEEAKIDEEAGGVAALATGVVASAAVVMTNGLSTAEPNVVEAVTTKEKEDHSADVPANEAVSTRSAITETVPEPIVKQDDVPLSSTTVDPDVVSSLEAKVEPELHESDSLLVEKTAIEPEVIVGDETEGRIEIDPSSETQVVPSSVTDIAPITDVEETVDVLAQQGPVVASLDSEVAAIPESEIEKEPHESDNLVGKAAIAPRVIVGEETEDRIKIEPSPATQTDVAPTTTEATIEVGENVGVLEKQGPVVAPLVAEVAAIPEPEIEKEAPAEHDLRSTTEESAAVFAPEPETSYAIEETPAYHSLLAKSGSPDENAVNESEAIEPKATEERLSSLVEDKTDVTEDKIGDSAPVLAATEQLHEVASKEIIQPQSAAVPITENVLDNKDTITSTKLEGHDTEEDIEAKKDFVSKEAKHDFDPVPEVSNLEHEVETEATVEPPLSTTIVQDLPTTVEPERDTAHSDKVAGIAAEGSSKVALDSDAGGGIELQSKLEEETLTVLSPSAQETEADVVSSSKDVLTAQKVETEVEAGTQGTDAATTTNELAAVESSEAEQPVVRTTEGDSTKHVIEAAIVAVGLATVEGFSSMDKVVPEVTHEATPETEDDSVERGTAEPQQEVDVTAPETEGAHPDIDSSHRNEPTPVPLPLEPGNSFIKTESAAEPQVETAATATTKSVATVVEDQPVPISDETAPNAQKDVEEVQTQVDDTSNIKDESIPESDVVQHIEAGDSELEGPVEEVPASNTKESQSTVQLEQEIDFVAPAEEEPSAITQVAAEHLSPKIESEEAISPAPGEIILIPEDATGPVGNVEDQPVDVPPEQVSSTEPAEAILPLNVEERRETLKPLVAPSYKDFDDEIVESHVVPEEDVHMPETHVGEAATVSIMAASAVKSDLGRGIAENVSVPSQELPENPEPEEPTAHEEAYNMENQVEIITSSTKLEGHGTAEYIEGEKDFVVKEAKHDSVPVPEVNNHDVETEATVEPPLPTSFEQDLLATTDLDTAHQGEPEVIAEDDSSRVALDADATGGIELQSELEQETLIPSAQETGVDALAAQEVETEVEARTQGTDAATTSNELTAVKSPETEQPVVPTTEGDSTKHVIEAAIVAVGLATAEGFSSSDKVVPEVTHEATPEIGSDSVERGPTEPQREHEVDVTAPESEDTHPDIDLSLRNEPTSVPLPHEPESSLIKTESAAEHQVETTATATTNSVATDVEDQPDPGINETAANADKDIEEVQTRVDDTSNIKEEPIPESDVVQHVDTIDTDLKGPVEEVPAPSTKEPQNTVQLEPEVDFVTPAEGEPSAITEVAAENLLPKIESEEAISRAPGETIPIPEEAMASVADNEDQIISPVNVQQELAAVVETSSTNKPAEVIPPPNVTESPETLTPVVEPSYKALDDKIVRSDVVPEDVHVPETYVEDASLVSIMVAAAVESDLGRSITENVSVPSHELPVNPEPEEPTAHKDNMENHVEIITSSTKLEEHGTADNIEAKKDFVVEEAKHEPDPVPEVNSLEHVETGATLEPSLPTSIEKDLPGTIEPQLDAHQDEPEVIAEQGSSTVVLDADATGGIELQSVLEQETLIPSAQRTGVDALTAQKVETEVEDRTLGTDASTTTNELPAVEFPETEHVVPTTEGDSSKHVDEAAIVAVGLTTVEGFSIMDKVVPEGVHEATPEAENDSVERETAERQREHVADVNASETEDPHPDIDSSLRNDSTPVPLPLEPESSLIKTDSAAEPQVETSATATTNSVATDVEDQPVPGSNETAPNPNALKDIEEVQKQVDDTSNIKDEPIPESDVIQHVETVDTELEGPVEEIPAPSTKESQNTVQWEEEPPAITLVPTENLSPKIEGEEVISRAPGETIPIPEEATPSVADNEEQIIAPVEVQPELAAVVETSSTEEPAEVIVPSNVEESPETLTPLIEPSYKSSDEIVRSQVVPEEDVHVPETHVEEAAIVSIIAATSVESDLRQGVAENLSLPSQELPMNPEPEEPVTHEEAVPISSPSLEIPEVDGPVAAETEPEPCSTNFTSQHQDSTLEVEERHVLLSPENPEAVNVESNDESVRLAAAEPGPEVVAAVEVPVLGTFASELQAQRSMEETTEEGHIVEAASEDEFIVPNEESTAEPVKEQLEIPEAGETGESDRTVDVVPQIIPAVVEESPSQIEDKPVLAAPKIDTTLSKAEPLDFEYVPENPAIVESVTDALHMDTSIPVVPIASFAAAALAPEVQEDATAIPEAESDLFIKTEGSSSIKEGEAVQNSLTSKSFVDTEVQPEAQELEETYNTEKADSSDADVNILPEDLPSTQGLIVAPLASEAAIPEPEFEKEAPPEHDLTTSVSTSEPGTSYAIEVTPAVDDSLLAEPGSLEDEIAVYQSETIEPRVTEAEHMSSPVEDKTDVTHDNTSYLAPILAAAQQPPEVASEEKIQPQSTEVLVSEDVPEDREIITSSKMEGHGTEENIEAKKDIVVKETKHDFDPVPVPPDVDNLEHEVKTEATAEPPLPTSIEKILPIIIEQELDAAHPEEPVAIAEGSPKIAPKADAIGECQSEYEQETLMVLSPSVQETGVDVASSSKDALTAVVAHEVETGVEAEKQGTDATNTTNDLAAKFPETEQPIIPTTEDDSTKLVNEAAVVAVGLAAVEGFSRIYKVEPEGIHEATPKAENDSVECGTPLNIEPQREREDDVIATETEDTHPDIHSSLHDDSTPIPLPLEPEIGLIKTELVTERQVEITSTATTKSVPMGVEDQPDPSSHETPPNTQKDIEVKTQLDDSSDTNDQPTPESDVTQDIEAADTEIEGPLKDVPASSVKLEPDVDFVATAEEEPSATAQGAEEDLLPNVESEGAISRTPGETMSIPSHELPVNPEPEEPVTHEEAVPISSSGPEIPEVNVPITLETEPEPRSTNSISEDKDSTLEVEERQKIFEADTVELNDDSIPLAAAEPGLEVVAAVEAPVLGTFELQAQHSVEETTEESHNVEAASETEFIVPSEESTAEPVKAHPEMPEAGESGHIAEVEPQIIPAIVEESPAQFEEDRPVLAALQDDATLPKTVHAELLDSELVPEDSAVVESETDALHMDTSIPVVPIPAIAVAALAPEVQEDATVMPESESDLPIKTEGSSPVKDGDAIQDYSSPSKSFVDTEVQLEAQEPKDTFNTDLGIADVSILPEDLPSRQGLIVTPLASEISIPEPEFEKEVPADLTSTAEGSLAVSASEPETYTIEVIPAAIDRSLLAESGIHDDKNAIRQSEIFEPRATEAEYMSSPVDIKTADADRKTSDSAPILPVAEQQPDVVSEDIVQPQSTAVLLREDVDNGDIITSTKLEGHGTEENIEAKKDKFVKEANVEPPLPTSIEHDLPTTIEHKLETAHSDESASLAAEGSSTVVLNADEIGVPSAQETGVDVVSSSKDALTAHEVETEVEAGTQETDTAISSNDLAATELPETEQPVMPNTEGDSTKHVIEAAIVGLATTEGFSSMDKVISEVTHEAAPEAENDSVESETTLNVELQREHEVDVTAPGTEDTHSDIHSSFHNDSTPVPLPLDPETDLIKTELVAEHQVETTSTATKSVTTDVEVQPDPSSSEIAPNTDTELQTQLDDTSNIKSESITESEVVQHIEAADAEPEGPLEDSSSSTKESQNNVQLEPDVAQAEEEPSAIAQVTAENLSPKIENVGGISPAPGEIIPIREDATTSKANVEDQVIAPVDVRSEHGVVVETSSTNKPGEVIIPSNVEENLETLKPPVEPSYKSSDDEIAVTLKSHVIPEEDVHAPETHVEEAALVSIMAATSVELDLRRGVAENLSIPSEELPVNPEFEEPVTHEQVVPISSSSLEIPEVDVPVTVETQPEPRSTNSISEDKISTLEAEERHVLLSPKNLVCVCVDNVELNDDGIPLAAAEPGPEVVAAVEAPVLGTLELQAQHSVEETTEEGHIVEPASDTEFIVPNEESTVEIVEEQLEIPEAGESDPTAEAESQILPSIVEESPAQFEEDRAVLAIPQDDTTLSKSEPLDSEHVPEDPAVMESEPDTLPLNTNIPVVPTLTIAVAAQAPEGQEDGLGTNVIPDAESDRPSHEIRDEGFSSIKEGDAVQNSSPSIFFIDTEPEAEVMEAKAEGSPKIPINVDATGDFEVQSEHGQKTPTLLSSSSQETGVDVVSSSRDALSAAVTHEVETEVEADTHGTDLAITTNDLAAAETEQPVMPTNEGDSTKHVNEAAIVAVGLATAEGFSSMDKVVPEVIHEVTPEVVNDSVNIEPQRDHEDDFFATETEDTHPDIPSSLHNDPTPVPLPLEPEIDLIKTGLVAERQVETSSTVTTKSVTTDVEVQPDPSDIALNTQKDAEVQTQVDDTSNVKDEPIPVQHIEAADTEVEGPLEDVPSSSTKESQNTVQLEPEVDFVAPAENVPIITQVTAENLSPEVESEEAVSQVPVETIPISEDATASVANAEDQIIAPVDLRSEHAAVVQMSSTDELAEDILSPNLEESPENLPPVVEPSYKGSEDEISLVVPEVDDQASESHVFGEAAPVSIMPATLLPSQELPLNPEPDEPAAHEEAVPISSSSLEIHEDNVPIIVESEPENRDRADIELNDDNISLAAAEPGPEVVATVEAPVLGAFGLQAHHSVEETTEEGHIVEAASRHEFIVPNEESTVDPVKAQLERPEAGESNRTAEVEPQIIPAIVEESPAQIEEDKPALAVLQDDTSLSKAEPLNSEHVPEDPAVVESEPYSLDRDTSIRLMDPPPLQTVETDHIGERSEGQGKSAILETTAVDDLAVDHLHAGLGKVEKQSFDETEAPETHVLNGNGHSTTTQETIGTHGLEASSVNFATDKDNIQADPKVIEPIHPIQISPATPEAPSTTDQQ